jgi:hypothetical protein
VRAWVRTAENDYFSIANIDKPAAVGFEQGDDAMALMIWLHRDEITERLEGMIEAAASPDALTPENKQGRVAELQAELLLLERQEVEGVFQAQNEGLNKEHRGDVNYLAFVGCMLVTASRPVTSHRLVWVLRSPNAATAGSTGRAG